MFYTHGTLDRADHLRNDDKALAALRQADTTRLLPVWRGTVLVTSGTVNGESVSASLASLAHDVDLPDGDAIFLGLLDEAAWFAVPVGELDDAPLAALAARATSPDGQSIDAEFADLRVAGPRLPANEGALLAYARGLVYWQEHSRFCDQCGRPLTSTHGGHVRVCDNADGTHSTFPRIDPAVIMLVVDDTSPDGRERCLLGRSPAWPEGVFSTLAGFVEPGESLEQAVQREVLEESGIVTTDVRYIASQPWPFPRSIMLGFEARATSREIVIDPLELADARWFTRKQLDDFGNWGDEGFELQLPRPDSIARFLIEDWRKRRCVDQTSPSSQA